MKVISRPVVAAVAVAAMTLPWLCGCGSKTQEQSGAAAPEISSMPVSMDLKNAECFYRLVQEQDTIYLDLSASVQWPTRMGDASIKALGDTILSAAFQAPAGSDAAKAMADFVSAQNAKAVIDMGQDSVQVTAVERIPQKGTGTWYSLVNGHVAEMSHQLVTYIVTLSTYSGGAHPITASLPFSYDLKRGCVLTLDNMFKPGSQGRVLEVVRRALARSLDVTPDRLEDAGVFVDQLTYPGLPYITDNVLMFHFNPYEIASYAMGDIDVAVFPQEVEEWLTPEAKALVDNGD